MVIETKFAKAFKILKDLEYSNKPELFLHKNRNEEYLTIGGVTEKWYPQLDWNFIREICQDCKGDFARASVMLHADNDTRISVFDLFKKRHWEKLRLDEIRDQNTCEELFISAVHIEKRNTVTLAQRIIGAKVDGWIGDETVRLLNAYDPDKFDVEFDQAELVYYQKTIGRNPDLKYAMKGFENRAYKV
jgi:hypothetical protein